MSDIAADLRRTLTPLLPAVIFTDMVRFRRAIREMFLAAMDVTVLEYAPAGTDLPSYREGLRAAGLAATFAIELAVADSDAPSGLRRYVGLLMEHLAAHIDPTRSVLLDALPEAGEFFQQTTVGLYEAYVRVTCDLRANWTEPVGKQSKKERSAERLAREARFLRNHPGTLSATIYHSASVGSQPYYRWRRGERSDSADVSLRIDAVLADRTPIRPDVSEK